MPKSRTRAVQAEEHAVEDRRHDLRRDQLLVRATGAKEPRQRLAVHVLHDEEQPLVGLHHVDHGNDVRMTNARDDARFVHEHRDELLVLEEVLVEALHRHRSPEANRPEQPPEMDRRHPARRELVEQRIPADDDRPGLHRCGGDGAGHYDPNAISSGRARPK